MEQETVFELASQGIDALCIALGAQGGHHQGLRFATGEQGRTMGAGQYARANFNGTNRAGVATIDAGLARQNLATHQTGFNFEQQSVDLDGVKFHALLGQTRFDRFISGTASLGAGLLVAQLIGLTQGGFSQSIDLAFKVEVTRRRLPFPSGFACVANQFVNGVDGHFALLVTKHHGAEHEVFGQLQGFRLDHQHGRLGACNHQIHSAVFALGLTRVEHVFAIDVAHACGANGAMERDARNAQSGRDGNHGGNVSVDFGIERHGVNHHMHFVVETFGEQRANGAVNQTAGEGFQFAGLGFTLEEAARDLASGIGFFDVIDGQREEILTGLGRLGSHNGGQHHGVVHVDQHGAGGLASNFAGFHGDRVLAPLEGFGDFVKQAHVSSLEKVKARSRRADKGDDVTEHDAIPASQNLTCWNDTASLHGNLHPKSAARPSGTGKPTRGAAPLTITCAGRAWR